MQRTYWIYREGAPNEGPYTLDQLTYMWQTGQATAVDLVAEDGTEEWFNVAYLMAPAALEPIKARRRKRRPYATAAAILAIFGLVMLLFFWPAGVVLLIASCVIDRTVWNCGQCGHDVQETTTVCPGCGANLRFEWHPDKAGAPSQT